MSRWKKLKERLERDRASREYDCGTYENLRKLLNTFDPNKAVARDRINNRTSDRTEWDLYLRPDSAFDSVLRRYFEIFRSLHMTLITHKSDSNKLKRIEAQPPGERMRVLWSEAV